MVRLASISQKTKRFDTMRLGPIKQRKVKKDKSKAGNGHLGRAAFSSARILDLLAAHRGAAPGMRGEERVLGVSHRRRRPRCPPRASGRHRHFSFDRRRRRLFHLGVGIRGSVTTRTNCQMGGGGTMGRRAGGYTTHQWLGVFRWRFPRSGGVDSPCAPGGWFCRDGASRHIRRESSLGCRLVLV
jgi:hypothetical protein